MAEEKSKEATVSLRHYVRDDDCGYYVCEMDLMKMRCVFFLQEISMLTFPVSSTG